MTKSNFKNIVMTSFQWRHHHYVREKRHIINVMNIFPIWAPLNQNFWLRQWALITDVIATIMKVRRYEIYYCGKIRQFSLIPSGHKIVEQTMKNYQTGFWNKTKYWQVTELKVKISKTNLVSLAFLQCSVLVNLRSNTFQEISAIKQYWSDNK